jgi:hypothetical protein
MPDRIRQTDPARALLFHARGATPLSDLRVADFASMCL